MSRCRAIAGMYATAPAEQQEFVHGEVACVMDIAPQSAQSTCDTALAMSRQPVLLRALERGRLGVPHALALLGQVEHLDPQLAAQVLADVLGDDTTDLPLGATPGQLRDRARRAAIRLDAEAARRRHEQARKEQTGVRHRPGQDGMAQLVVTAPAETIARIRAALRARADVMPFEGEPPTTGEREVAGLAHALTCERTLVQAVIECPVEAAVDLHALTRTSVWTVDVRMPAAVALGLSDHPAVLAGYGPIGADEARALLPQADLVRACVDSRTGEVLAVDPPVRRQAWQNSTSGVYTRPRGTADDPEVVTVTPTRARRRRRPPDLPTDLDKALRAALVEMVTTPSTVPDLRTRAHDPSEALGRLVDLRDETSVFPGDATSSRRTHRDHRFAHPLGATDADNLQNLSQRWHRAKHAGWHTTLLADGTVRWTSPRGGTYDRPPRRTPPPPIDRDTLPP